MPWEVGRFNILHVCRNRNIVDILLDYSVAYFDWTDRGESDLGAREVKARTRKAVMGGMGQTHLRAMSPGEITAQPIDALASEKRPVPHAGLRGQTRRPLSRCSRCLVETAG